MSPPLPILSEEITKDKPKTRDQAKGKKVSFKKRYLTLKKKAEELGKLCDTQVCYVCFGPEGEFYTLPEEKTNMEDTFTKFKENTSLKENKNLLGFLEDKKKKHEGKKNITEVKKFEKLFASWNKGSQELCDKTLVNFHDYLENKLQVLTERSRLLEEEEEKGKTIQLYNDGECEKGKAIQFCNDGESSQSSLNRACSFDLFKTNNLNVDQQSCNPLLSLGSGTDCYNNQKTMMSLEDKKLAANYVTSSTWPLNYYTDVGSSSSNGSNCLLEVLDSNTDFGIPKNFDLMGYGENNILTSEVLDSNTDYPSEFAQTNMENFDLMGYNNNGTPVVEINSDILPNNNFPSEFAQTNMGFNTEFGIPENIGIMGDDYNFDLTGYNNNSTPVVEINRSTNVLPNNDFPLEFAQTNMGFNTEVGIRENFDMMVDDSNILPNNDIPLEFADITTDFGAMENSSLMGKSNNDFFPYDDGAFSQSWPLF